MCDVKKVGGDGVVKANGLTCLSCVKVNIICV